jgi:hypothetical protein
MPRELTQEEELEILADEQWDDYLTELEELELPTWKLRPYSPPNYDLELAFGCTWKTRMRAAP